MATANLTGDRPPIRHRIAQEPIIALALLAATATIILTGSSFWLSYEHLHDIAAAHGLQDARARAWAWPATVDLFIVIGEILILRASFARRGAALAILLTVLGSGGSIALNIAGVGSGAPPMDYVVAAVPPVASLFAFGALMWQIHGWINARANTTATPAPAPAPQLAPADPAPANDIAERPTEPTPALAPAVAPPPPAAPPAAPAAPTPRPARTTAANVASTADAVAAKAAIRALYANGTRPGTKLMQAAVYDAIGGDEEPAGSTVRYWRGCIEAIEPDLKQYPAAG